MEENCGGGQGLNWAVEPRTERVSTRTQSLSVNITRLETKVRFLAATSFSDETFRTSCVMRFGEST
jgi:hypothetical protein